jgi:riboflavin kinase / FMN adenylyltransferase
MPTILSIGTFDGVHRGHQRLIARARKLADGVSAGGRAGSVTVLAFDPHPSAVLQPGLEPARLTTFAQRAGLLRAAGADHIVHLDPSPELLALSAEEFIASVIRDYAPAAIVEGADFHFGRGRRGNLQTLVDLGREHGFRCEVVPALEIALTDCTPVTASSSITRWLIGHGRVRDAAAVLGRPHSVAGVVVRGDQRGRVLGFRTANVETPCMVPGEGIYAGIAHLEDGRRIGAAVHVGPRPTFDEPAYRVEAHLLGVECDENGAIAGMPEYGWSMELSFVARLRDQMRFDSVPALVDQMARDCERAWEVLKREDISVPEPAMRTGASL